MRSSSESFVMMILRSSPTRPSKILTENVQRPHPPKLRRGQTFTRKARFDVVLGSRVLIKGGKMGTVRYIGEIRFATGLWCGVELDKPEGRHNGEKYGVRYFQCKNNHGIYVPSYKVLPVSRFIETVSENENSLSSIDSGHKSLVSRSFLVEFLQESNLCETDVWNLINERKLERTCDTYCSMPADPLGLRDASGARKMPSQKIPVSLIKQNDKSNTLTERNAAPVSRRTVMSARDLNKSTLIPSTDNKKKTVERITKNLNQPKNLPAASRTSKLRENLTKLKDPVPKKPLDGRASYKIGKLKPQDSSLNQSSVNQRSVGQTKNSTQGSEAVKKATNKTTHSAPKVPEDDVDERKERQSSKVDFEVEIARLGEVCEARSAELETLRKQLQDSTVAHGALAFAAHYWSERLRKTEEYSARLKRQLQLAGKVISNAHNNIENLENKLQQEVATHKDEMQKFEETKQQRITELEAKQISVVEELRTEHERKIDELKSSLATASEDTVHKSKLIELQEEHERALEALRESKEAEFNALRGTQRDLERRLDEKNQQCRRVEEEAAALKAKLLQSADARAQWLNEKINSLEKEVESLNAVLEMKVAENRELLAEKRENQDRKERMALMQEALDKQRAKIEDLKAQLDIKAETQQKLKSENAKLLQLSESKDRIISKMGRNFEELKYKMQDGSSFTVDVSTPVHRPLRETKSFGAPSNGAEVEDAMSRSWHLSLREKSQKKSNHSRSASSDSKNSEDGVRPHVLDDVFTQEERTALEETVSAPVAAASRA